ncbi:hypothetical protein IPZ68_13350 [Streptomyces arenae]|nr:hypothetical protein [Streptomyces arenae]
MGVFARFRRKIKDSEEASTTEAAAATLTAEPEEAKDSPEASADAKPAAEADTDAESAAEDKPAETAEAAAAEGVEIPKQQSAEEAADNEAGESARK